MRWSTRLVSIREPVAGEVQPAAQPVDAPSLPTTRKACSTPRRLAVYSSVTHFSETSRFPVLSLCLLLVPYHPRCGPRSYSKFRAFRPRRGLQSGQQRRARTRRPTTMARQKQSSTSSRPRKRSRGSTASPSSSNGNNLNNGMHCACVFHVGVQHLCAYLTKRRVGDVYRVAINQSIDR